MEELKALWVNANTPGHLIEPTEPDTTRGEVTSAKDKGKKSGGSKETGKEALKSSVLSGSKSGADMESQLPPDLQRELEELVIEEWDLCIKTLTEVGVN